MYVIKQNENGTDRIAWKGNPEGLVRSLRSDSIQAYPLLQSISLYEDTYFNSWQIGRLVGELEDFANKIADGKNRDELHDLI